jgi:hypothetical protein
MHATRNMGDGQQHDHSFNLPPPTKIYMIAYIAGTICTFCCGLPGKSTMGG